MTLLTASGRLSRKSLSPAQPSAASAAKLSLSRLLNEVEELLDLNPANWVVTGIGIVVSAARVRIERAERLAPVRLVAVRFSDERLLAMRCTNIMAVGASRVTV